MKIAGVYQIQNRLTGHRYIGSSVNIKLRWSVHRHHLKTSTHCNKYLQRAWDKYGKESFIFTIIEECENSKIQLELTEQKYLDLIKPEYNILKVAYSQVDHPVSEETKQKLSLAHIGKIVSEESKHKMSLAKLGKPSLKKGIPISEEQKRKMSLALTGLKRPRKSKGKVDKLIETDIYNIYEEGIELLKSNSKKLLEALAGKYDINIRYLLRILRGQRKQEEYFKFFGIKPEEYKH
jgi:group I intron endonuclease